MVDKPRPWLTIAMRGEGQFENMSEVTARRQAEIAFLTGLHHRCGSMSIVSSLPPDVARWILELIRPITINAACSRVMTQRSSYFCCMLDDKDGHLVLVAEEKGEWESFVQRLPPNRCVLALANFGHVDEKTVLVSVQWAPEAASMKEKLLLCSMKESFLRRMLGSNNFPIQIQATAQDELAYDEVKDKIFREQFVIHEDT